MVLLWVKYSFKEYPQLLESVGDKRNPWQEEMHLYTAEEYLP
jgi:hypothetical protein